MPSRLSPRSSATTTLRAPLALAACSTRPPGAGCRAVAGGPFEPPPAAPPTTGEVGGRIMPGLLGRCAPPKRDLHWTPPRLLSILGQAPSVYLVETPHAASCRQNARVSCGRACRHGTRALVSMHVGRAGR